MTTIALRVTPTPGSIIINQARSLMFQNKWELLLIGIVTAIYHLGTLNTDNGIGPLIVFRHGALGFAGSFIFMVLSGYWAIRVWDGFNIGDRSSFFSFPADRAYHRLFRVAAGALILIAVMTVFWLLGATVVEIIKPGYSWFTSPEQSGWAWTISLFGILNAYLYGSILALLFRKPEVWFVFWIPVSFIALNAVIPRLGIKALNVIIEAVFWYPTGMFSGFGFTSLTVETAAMDVLPDLPVVLMWTAIFAAGVFFIARIHRED